MTSPENARLEAEIAALRSTVKALREAARDVLGLPIAKDALEYLNRGFGVDTEDAAWLRLRQVLAASADMEG